MAPAKRDDGSDLVDRHLADSPEPQRTTLGELRTLLHRPELVRLLVRLRLDELGRVDALAPGPR